MASAARVTRCPTALIVRPMAVVRVAGVTALGPVADALVALVLVLVAFAVIVVAVITAANAATSRDCGAGERHVTNASGAGPRIPVQRATGKRDGRAGQDVALERRGRHRRGRVNPPRHVARLRAAGQHYREVGAGERTRRDLDQPGRIRAATERQHAS